MEKELEFIYDEDTDIFIWPNATDVYIAVPTGQYIHRPEDHPTKNTVEYKALAIRTGGRHKQMVETLGTGRETKIGVLVARDCIRLTEGALKE